MNNIKSQNIAVLDSTKDDCSLYKVLSEGVAFTRGSQSIISADSPVVLPPARDNKKPEVIISQNDCVTAAAAYRDKKTMIVNLGSATTQGGGASTGENDSESDLCRKSTLFPCLAWKDLWKDYYLPNKQNLPLISDMVYSPDIIIFKSVEETAKMLPEEDWYKCDVLTAPVPNNDKSITELELFFGKILQIAALKGVKAIVCPAPHKNCQIDEKILVKALEKAIAENPGWIETIEFALYPKYTLKKTINAFVKTFVDND